MLSLIGSEFISVVYGSDFCEMRHENLTRFAGPQKLIKFKWDNLVQKDLVVQKYGDVPQLYIALKIFINLPNHILKTNPFLCVRTEDGPFSDYNSA